LLNDGVNKRKDVQAALESVGVAEPERIMQRAHRKGAALVARFDSLHDTYAFEPAYDTYAKLKDRGLKVAFVPVPADEDVDDEQLETVAELQEIAEDLDVEIGDEVVIVMVPAWVTCSAVILCAVIGVSLVLLVNDRLAALLGQWLGGGGLPPGF
jgi:hypothetical protein